MFSGMIGVWEGIKFSAALLGVWVYTVLSS